MSPEINDLLKRALALSADERAALANSLLDSLDPSSVEFADEAWEHEVERRKRDLESGKATTVAWEDVKRQMRSAVDGR